ncbi:MAG: MoaD/ThiS family protein [Pseudomonadota bacterium]|nr:MoaD/ThiS family protein [Pseudomonadota bacterium]
MEHNSEADAGQQQRHVTILYFAYLVNKLRKESEELTLPEQVDTVEKLIAHLQRRERDRGYLLAAEHIQVTVNREFSESFTRIDDGDEIGITPVTPTPPAAPK